MDVSSYSAIKPYTPNYGSTPSSQVNNDFSIKHKEKQKALRTLPSKPTLHLDTHLSIILFGGGGQLKVN